MILLILSAAIAGAVDAAARKELIGKGLAASLILVSLLCMLLFLGVASKNHSTLALNTLFAAASAAVSYLLF